MRRVKSEGLLRIDPSLVGLFFFTATRYALRATPLSTNITTRILLLHLFTLHQPISFYIPAFCSANLTIHLAPYLFRTSIPCPAMSSVKYTHKYTNQSVTGSPLMDGRPLVIPRADSPFGEDFTYSIENQILDSLEEETGKVLLKTLSPKTVVGYPANEINPCVRGDHNSPIIKKEDECIPLISSRPHSPSQTTQPEKSTPTKRTSPLKRSGRIAKRRSPTTTKSSLIKWYSEEGYFQVGSRRISKDKATEFILRGIEDDRREKLKKKISEAKELFTMVKRECIKVFQEDVDDLGVNWYDDKDIHQELFDAGITITPYMRNIIFYIKQ